MQKALEPGNRFERTISRFSPLLLTGVLLLAAIMLSVHLGADAPDGASESAGLHFDAPSKCHNARNFVLFDRWVVDEWTPFIHSPLHTLIQTGVFSITGIGTVSMRLTSVLASLLSIWLLFLLVRKDRGAIAALLAAVLMTFSFDVWVYGRSGLLEPLVMCLMLATLWALRNGYQADEDDQPFWKIARWFAASAALAMAMLLAKLISAYVVVALALIVCLFPPRRKRVLLVLFGVLALLLGLYAGPFVQINAPYFERESAYWIKRAGSSDYLRLWLTQPLFFTLQHTSALTHLAALALCSVFFGLGDRRTRARRIVPAIMALILIFGSQFLSVVSYRPQRYYVPLLVPICFLATIFIHSVFVWVGSQVRRPRQGGLSRYAVALPVLTFVLALSPLNALRLLKVTPELRMLLTASCVALALLIWNRCGGPVMRWFLRIPGHARTGGLLVGMAVFLLGYARFNSHPYRHWLEHPRYGMLHFSEMLGTRYRDMHIAGTTPLFCVIDNTHHAYKVTSYHLNWEAMQSGAMTHAVIPTEFGQLRFFQNTFSNQMATASAVEKITIGGHLHILYAFDRQPLHVEMVQKDNGSAELMLHNPDLHTPRTVTLIGPETDPPDLSGRFTGRMLDLLPGDTASAQFLSSKELDHTVLVPREAWRSSNEGWIQARRVERQTDAYAWNVETIALCPSRDGRPGMVTIKAGTESAPVFAGIRLRSEHNEGQIVLVEWIRGDRVLLSRSVPASELSPDGYTPVIFALQGDASVGDGALRVSCSGTGRLYADAVLFLTDKDVGTFAVKTVAAQ